MHRKPFTIHDIAEDFGINHLATWQLAEFDTVDEAAIINDLKNGLLHEWLRFVSEQQKNKSKLYQQQILQLFLLSLSDNFSLLITPKELERMINYDEYPGRITVINYDSDGKELRKIKSRLTLDQYIYFMEIAK